MPTRIFITILYIVLPVHTVLAGGNIQGFLQAEGITGKAAPAHGWQQENIYLGPLAVGYGTGCNALYDPPGWYALKPVTQPFPAGRYALFNLSVDGGPAFSFRADVAVPEGSTVLDPVRLTTPAHYAVMYNKAFTEWGSEPWIWGASMHQTFVAASPYITRIGTRLAGKSGDHHWLLLNLAVYEAGAGSPATWRKVSPTRSIYLGGNVDPIIHFIHAPFRSHELHLTPGRMYAVRFWADPTSQSTTFAMVARTGGDSGYADGRLYVDGLGKADLDAYAYISGGAPGTIVNHAPVGDRQLKEFLGSGTRHGQTFVATGCALAGADFIYATGAAAPPAYPLTFQLYDDVGGRAIGPARTCHGVPGFYQARAAAFWEAGEVELMPGRRYYLEVTSPGLNVWLMNENVPGAAYRDRSPHPRGADLMMSIAEYEVPIALPRSAETHPAPSAQPARETP